MTFSISARCRRTGLIGIAVSSSSPAVAARCAHARARVGAVATQNVTDPTLGPKGLDLMASGLSAGAALERLKATQPHLDYRQLALVDAAGGTAHFSGKNTLGTHRAAAAEGVVAAGNLLADAAVPERMIEAYGAADHLELGDRLMTAMRAAIVAGGEAGPVHSAGMLLVREVAWPVADLRVDWHEDDPIEALAALWVIWKPQLDDYVTRALDPAAAPSYGVAGNR
jgi:uncharacterized Ntn-hydrolase superfamily protein